MSESVMIVQPDDIEAFAKALATPVRRRIVSTLRGRELNVNEIASELEISQSAAVTHVQLLERAALIQCRTVPKKKGAQKVCTAPLESAVVLFSDAVTSRDEANVSVEMPIGLFFEHEVHATCGMASMTGYIGYRDAPDTFLDPQRSAAELLWFAYGYVEYRMPLPRTSGVRAVAVSVELCSEYPGHNSDWPSDITAWFNGVEVGTFRSPGDPGDRRGHLNPSWWVPGNTQYGYLKEWRVSDEGAYIDGVRVSETTLADVGLGTRRALFVRFGIKDDAEFRGGLNLFGSRFGNYPQGIRLTLDLTAAPGGAGG